MQQHQINGGLRAGSTPPTLNSGEGGKALAETHSLNTMNSKGNQQSAVSDTSGMDNGETDSDSLGAHVPDIRAIPRECLVVTDASSINKDEDSCKVR